MYLILNINTIYYFIPLYWVNPMTGVTWVELVDDHTFTFHPPPSTMEISFPTLSDPEWMNQSCQIEQSQELFRQYQVNTFF
jgi:hypothetical protein